jgi:thiamine kinase-like enzyme
MSIYISLLESKVNKKMKTLSSKSKFLEEVKVAPIHHDYQYRNVGLMLFVGKWDLVKQTMY